MSLFQNLYKILHSGSCTKTTQEALERNHLLSSSVAWSRFRPWKVGQALLYMSKFQISTSCCSSSPMCVVFQILARCAHRLCWSIHGSNVPIVCGFPFKVGWGDKYGQVYNSGVYRGCSSTSFCSQIFLLNYSPSPIMASQPQLTSITPMDDFLTVSASGDFLPNGLATSSYLTNGILYVNDILLIDITECLLVIYIYSRINSLCCLSCGPLFTHLYINHHLCNIIRLFLFI